MLHFPGQDERSLDLRTRLAKEFDLANRIFEFWMRAPKDEWLDRSELSPAVKFGAAMPLNSQACRLMQSLVTLCENADGFGADILARSLFETSVATCFVLEERSPIRLVQKTGHGGGTRYSARAVPKNASVPPKEYLSRDFRATLYVAYQPLRTEKLASRLAATDQFKQLGESLAQRYTPEMLARFKAAIGPAWTSVLTNAPTYSGLSIRNLAMALGHETDFWYQSFYFLQSRNAHGSDPAQHANKEFGPLYFSDATDVSNVLFAGISMFMLCLVAVQEAIFFGESVDAALAGFRDEYHALM